MSVRRYETKCEKCRRRPTLNELLGLTRQAEPIDERQSRMCLRCLNDARTYDGLPRILVGAA